MMQKTTSNRTKYKVLIFDLDDTLIDNLENTRNAFKKMVEHYGEIYNDKKFKRWYNIDKKFWHDWRCKKIELPDCLKLKKDKKSEEFLNWVRAQRILNYFDNKITLNDAIELNYIYIKSLTEVVIAIEGAFETLKYCSNTQKYHIIVATNGPESATNIKLSKIKCLDFVENIFSADMLGYVKPQKEFFYYIKNSLNNYNNNDFLIIGDSLETDIGFGMACGFDSCWFNRKNERFTKNYKPTFTIKKLTEIKNIL